MAYKALVMVTIVKILVLSGGKGGKLLVGKISMSIDNLVFPRPTRLLLRNFA